jgi:hypothetical protein
MSVVDVMYADVFGKQAPRCCGQRPATHKKRYAKVLCRARRRRNNGSKMRERCRESAASDSNSPKVLRRLSCLASVQIKSVRTRTQTNTNRNDREVNAAGRRGYRMCSANGTCENQGA